LVGLKEITEAGFTRMSSELKRIEARVARIESWNLNLRFDALEQRVARLERT
jgi:hypothetical protein